MAAPLQAQGLERGPQLPAVCTVAVVQIVHKRNNPAVLNAEPDLGGKPEGAQHRALPQAPHQLAANKLPHAFDLGNDFRHRPAAGAFAVKGRDAAEFAVEVTAARGESALARHVGRVGQ